ncbi:hypothetical protein GCM10022285_17010 [Streptomyces tunisiensis]|uniref:Uncharacterized protein n=1 Tax=Streptomyces tunisiensis TaxID=948699 RepID=A0ABP7Y238_9ACTN
MSYQSTTRYQWKTDDQVAQVKATDAASAGDRMGFMVDGRGSHAAASRSPGPDSCMRTAVAFQ